MPKYGLLVTAIVSLFGLVVSSDGVRATTIHECNTMYNTCSANCDKYAPNAGSAAMQELSHKPSQVVDLVDQIEDHWNGFIVDAEIAPQIGNQSGPCQIDVRKFAV